jgi:OOP family OmpA-OmpF porin
MKPGRWLIVAAAVISGCVSPGRSTVPAQPTRTAHGGSSPDYPTTDAGVVTVAPVSTGSDVVHIAPDLEHVIWRRMAVDAGEVVVVDSAPPARPAATAAQGCADADRDGVCNDRDRCPDTPAGESVDTHGCACDLSVQLQFQFDSAALTVEDQRSLDRIAAWMKELEFVVAEATGHTDSTGSTEYNQTLSVRRAQATVDYLSARGVTASRVRVVGAGESSPVAQNSTPDGRAKNRRVVLRRLDCVDGR